MQFQHENRTYKYYFQYEFPHTKNGNKKSNRPAHTTKVFLVILPTNGGEPIFIGDGVVRLWQTDAPCSETARKYAIKKLLDKVSPGAGGLEFRTAFWNSYVSRPRPKNTDRLVHALT